MTTLRTLVVLTSCIALSACAMEDADTGTSGLEISTLDDTTIAGVFVHGGSVVAFESTSVDQQTATLHLDVNGAIIDAEMVRGASLAENGNNNALYADDHAALIALRDALLEQYPEEVVNTFQGEFLARHTGWVADAPIGYTFGIRNVDATAAVPRIAEPGLAAPEAEARQISRTTHDDDKDTTCLWPGSNYYAYFDAGNGGQQWYWYRTANSGSCLGRCGAGCNWFDDDIMLDCFEHDSCVDHFGGSSLGGNSNCGDEFDHAVAEYIVTYGAWCPY